MRKRTIMIFFIILILPYKIYSKESISKLVCTTDKKDNNYSPLFVQVWFMGPKMGVILDPHF